MSLSVAVFSFGPFTLQSHAGAGTGAEDINGDGDVNGMSVSTTYASTYQPFVASNMLFELSTDGGFTCANCVPLTTYTAGYFNTTSECAIETSECAIEAKPLPTGTP